MSAGAKGTCPVCGQSVPLYRGALRSHQQQVSPLQAVALHPVPVTCPGSTRQPGPYEPDGQEALFGLVQS